MKGESMNRRESGLYAMLTTVAAFAAERVGLFSKASAAMEILKTLEDGIKRMSEEAQQIVSAETAIRISRIDRSKAREGLKTTLIAARQVAEALNFGEFRMPEK